VNVGAGVLEAILPLMTAHDRVVCCGAVASYDTAQDAVLAPGPRGIPLLIVNNALRIEGFLTADFMPEWGDALDQLAGWSQQGQLKTITKVWDGLDAAPAALVACWPGRTSDKSWSVLVQPDVTTKTRPRRDLSQVRGTSSDRSTACRHAAEFLATGDR
jgi:NADPH-dependent curcumin reductase CurA